METAGLTSDPLTAEEKIRSLAADQVIGMQNNSNPMKLAYDTFYNQSSKDFKSWVQEPANREAFEQYLSQISKGDVIVKDANGNFVVDRTKLLEPTNINSSLASLFYDWPVGLDSTGKWNDDYKTWVFAGNTPKSDDNMADSAEGVAYQKKLDDEWKKYQMQGGEKSRMDWFKQYKPDASGNATGEVTLKSTESDKPNPAEDF